MSARRPRSQAGFTLIEAIMVIVITGILAGIVAVFITKPVQGYVDSVRRAELTDAADVALRRMTRDIRLALPNSLRIRDTTTVGSCAAGTCYIEFIITGAGGRYRDSGDGSTGGTAFNWTDTTSCGTTPNNCKFDVLGTMPANPAITANDYIVIYNLGEGYNPANAYNYDATADACRAGGCNIAKVSATPAANLITLTANPFAAQSPPLPSPDARFQVVPGGTQAVTYACPKSVAGNLSRQWAYGFNATQAVPSGGSSAILAANATCTIDYAPAATGRNGLLFLQLTLTDSPSGESVSLFQQIHVGNAP